MRLTPLRIYVAGPYTASTTVDIERNVAAAIDAGLHLWKEGHFPYIPHLTHFIDLRAAEVNLPMSYEEYLAWDLEWLKVCDAFLYLGSSRGADLELETARKIGLVIFRALADCRRAAQRSLSGWLRKPTIPRRLSQVPIHPTL